MGITLRPRYVRYSYMDRLGCGHWDPLALGFSGVQTSEEVGRPLGATTLSFDIRIRRASVSFQGSNDSYLEGLGSLDHIMQGFRAVLSLRVVVTFADGSQEVAVIVLASRAHPTRGVLDASWGLRQCCY